MIPTRIIDNVLPQAYADNIEQDVMSGAFPWNYMHDITYDTAYGSNSGFVNIVYEIGKKPTEWFPYVKPIIYNIEAACGYKMNNLLRIRVGLLQSKVNSPEYDAPHIDFNGPHITACYYPADADGDTFVFDQTFDMIPKPVSEHNMRQYTKNTNFTIATQSTPKKNRVCVFDGIRFHASSRPKIADRRVVITINYN